MRNLNFLTATLLQRPRRVACSTPCALFRTSAPTAQRWQSADQAAGALSKDGPQTPSATRQPTQPSQIAMLPPHSLLPTKMLIRASLVTTVTSKPWLLNLTLKFLIFLTKTQVPVFQVGKNPIVHSLLKHTFYNHFCAGESGAEVMNNIRVLKDIGFKGVILTYAREIVVDASLVEKGKGTLDLESGRGDIEEPRSTDIDLWREGVLKTVCLLGEDDFLALKLTGAGASVMSSLASNTSMPKQMTEALEVICTEALRRKVRILVDAEQQSVQQGIDTVALDLMRKYNNESSNIYNTYQAYLKSTPANLASHMELAREEGFTLGVKLVRGAYMASEPRHLINDTKADTDESYNSIAVRLLKQSYLPSSTQNVTNPPPAPTIALFLATHNKESATLAHDLHSSRLKSNDPTISSVQYGQLLGMADEVSCSLLQVGQIQKRKQKENRDTAEDMAVPPAVYKCLSWGPLEDCLSYLLRRARENKDAIGRSKAEHRAVWAEVWRRARASISF